MAVNERISWTHFSNCISPRLLIQCLTNRRQGVGIFFFANTDGRAGGVRAGPGVDFIHAGGLWWYINCFIWVWCRIFEFWCHIFEFWRDIFEFRFHVFEFWRQKLKLWSIRGCGTQCLTCSRSGTKKKSSQFKLLDSHVGLIFRSALPEELEWDNRAEDVALSLKCLINMLTALDRDTPQTRDGLAPHYLPK